MKAKLRILMRFAADVASIVLLCIAGSYAHLAIVEGSFNPIKAIGGGLFFYVLVPYAALYPFIPIPLAFICYGIFALSIRLAKSRILFFVLSWLLVALNNYHAVHRAAVQNLSAGTVRIDGHELYQDGAVTSFGFFALNVGPEILLALFATGLLLLSGLRILQRSKQKSE